MNEMNVGDLNSDEKGSGARANGGKARYDLIPLHLLEGTARVLEFGAEKYAAWNWAKGMQWTIPYACIIRHLAAWFRGETHDPESGQSHLDHVICNVLMLKHYEDHYREGDNRPTAFRTNNRGNWNLDAIHAFNAGAQVASARGDVPERVVGAMSDRTEYNLGSKHQRYEEQG